MKRRELLRGYCGIALRLVGRLVGAGPRSTAAALGLLVAVPTALAGAIEAAPGTVVRWQAPETQSCALGERSWGPLGDTCYYPIDLLAEGELEIHRRRAGVAESARVRVADYPYRVQHIRLPDDRRVEPSPADAARAEREAERIGALWSLASRRRFELPLLPPLDRLPEADSFGSRRFFNGKPRSPHTGEDYSVPRGTVVRASGAGRVEIAAEHFYGGRSVFIDHGAGLVTMYMHLDSIAVEEGDEVVAGETIGRVGATGRATGPHLHFGVRWHGARIDPAVLMFPDDGSR